MLMKIIEFFFDSARHYIQLLILILLICPWHWTTTKRHKIEFGQEKKPEKKDDTSKFKAHSD